MISVRHRWLYRDTLGESQTQKRSRRILAPVSIESADIRHSGILGFVYLHGLEVHDKSVNQCSGMQPWKKRKRVLNEEWRQHERERGKQLDEYVE